MVDAIEAVEALYADVKVQPADQQPLLTLRRARQRLTGHSDVARRLLEPEAHSCRWLEPARSSRGDRTAALAEWRQLGAA